MGCNLESVDDYTKRVYDEIINQFSPDDQLHIIRTLQALTKEHHLANAANAYEQAKALEEIANKFK